MLQINKILFPTNCSAAAKKAFAYTLSVAKYFGASVDILYICEPSPDVVTPTIIRHQLQEEEKKSAQKKLKEFVKEFEVHRIPIHQEVELGYARENIATYANKTPNIDLIAMGADENNSLTQAIWGTAISSTIEYVQQPVLVIPKGILFQDIKHIAYVIPPNEDGQQNFPQVAQLAKNFEATLFVASLHPIGTTMPPAKQVIHLADYTTDLQSFVYNKNIHLLVTASSTRNNLSRLLQYSSAQKMALRATIPLLVLKKKATSQK